MSIQYAQEMSSGTPGCLISTRLTSHCGEQWVMSVYTFVRVGVCVDIGDPCGKVSRRSFWPKGHDGQGSVSNKIFSNVTTSFSRGLSVHTACTQHARVYLVPGNKWWNLNPFAEPELISFSLWSRFQRRNRKLWVSVLLWIMKLLCYQFCPLLNIALKSFQVRSGNDPFFSRVTPPSHSYSVAAFTSLTQFPASRKVSPCSSSHSCNPQPIHLLPQGQVSEAPWMSSADDRPIDTSVWSWKQISVLLLKQECSWENHPWLGHYLSHPPQAKIEKYFSIYSMSKLRSVLLNCIVAFQSRERSFAFNPSPFVTYSFLSSSVSL